jgi:hypothetical protein
MNTIEEVRSSSLPRLCKCSLGWLIDRMENEVKSWIATQTGTAVHRLVELHYHGKSLKDAMAQVEVESIEVPPGARFDAFGDFDRNEAGAMTSAYIADKRNQGLTLDVEIPVRLELPPDPSDPTGLPIVIPGHIDQARAFGRVLEVWDLKTGKHEGETILNEAVLQLAAYTVALQEKFPQRCHLRSANFF